LLDVLEKFSDVTVLVIGDIMLDRYWWGSVSRISPEAPVPVVKMENMSLAAGGAANVAANVAGLGARPVLVGVVGDDAEAGLLPDVLAKRGVSAEHLLRVPGRPTTVKTRIIAHSQQIARIDQETDSSLDGATESSLLKTLGGLIPTSSAIVISDYAKGVLSESILDSMIKMSREEGKPVLVDPKGKDYSKYRGATLLTPNRREAADACGLEENTQQMVDVAGRRLLAELDLDRVLITQGEDGMTLFRQDVPPYHLNTLARDVYDVTGAGDTVIGSLAVAVGAGADLETAANIANAAAGLVVEQIGTAVVTAGAVREAIDRI
jgi:D-beta-D-heptose 7-phosphate kinase/D-beta-D-heptose 1-phosphate adenosyltransferase